jgi:hypothetical protein
VVAAGLLSFYEGYSMEATYVRVMKYLGISKLQVKMPGGGESLIIR